MLKKDTGPLDAEVLLFVVHERNIGFSDNL